MSESYVTPEIAAVNVDLTGRSALVTGAASGIGRSCFLTMDGGATAH